MELVKRTQFNRIIILFAVCASALQVGCSSTNRQATTPFQPQQFQLQGFQQPQFQPTGFQQGIQSQQGMLSQFQSQAQNVQDQFAQTNAQLQNTMQQPTGNWGQQLLNSYQANYASYPPQYGQSQETGQQQGFTPSNYLPSFQGMRNMFQASQPGGQAQTQNPLGFAGVSC